MLDFFSRGSKGRTDPLANAAAAKAYVEELKREFGASAPDRVAELLASMNSPSLELTPDLLEAVLALNQETQPLHEALCVQYLMNARMPKMLETQLRSQILNYGKQFTDFYQYALPANAATPGGAKIRALLPLVLARMMYYLIEYARWQYVRNFHPDEVFWLNVNQLYRFAEQQGLDSTAVFLFGDHGAATTVQDQYLILQMLSLLSSGNLNPRQLNFAYEVLARISNRMALTPRYSDDASFVVTLNHPHPASRARAEAGNEMARYWNTADMVEILHGWAIVMEHGRIPPELKPLIEPGVDAGVLNHLTREWAAKPVVFERAERVAVSNRHIEVAHRLPQLHKLIRKPDEEQAQGRAAEGRDSYDDAANIRIYGFVTSRKRDKSSSPLPPSTLSLHGETAEAPAPAEFQKWEVENISQTGLGVSLDVMGNEWVGLGSLIGYREGTSDNWSLGIVRRLKRSSRERIYLGVETLSNRPLAASLRPTDSRLIDPTLPPDQVWLAGHISVFMPCRRGGKIVNALVLPLSLYMLGKQFYMSARGKHFQIALGKVMEKGSDWCLAEIELVQKLDKLPVVL